MPMTDGDNHKTRHKHIFKHLLGHRDVGAALAGVILRGGEVHDLGRPAHQLPDEKGEVLWLCIWVCLVVEVMIGRLIDLAWPSSHAPSNRQQHHQHTLWLPSTAPYLDGVLVGVAQIHGQVIIRVHERHEPRHQVVDELEGARLGAVACV